MRIEWLASINQISEAHWNQLLPSGYPFLNYRYLAALENSQSACRDTGWAAQHIAVYQEQELIACMPMYLKTHSYGEYVFDWQWAEAYQEHGYHYYPKLVSAIPFTPASGRRWLIHHQHDENQVLTFIYKAILEHLEEHNISSWHLLFSQQTAQFLEYTPEPCQPMARDDIQFHWQNHGFSDFEHFLTDLRSSKRKQIRRERRKVLEQQIVIEQIRGKNAQPEHWQAFYHCYQMTYLKRSGHGGYLTPDFFQMIADSMSNQILLVLASQDENYIACSLFFYDETHLYGRYWGALADIDCLHFECCYYQGIEFAIANQLQTFDPGTQGEHKLTRGFIPIKTQSLHWIAHPEFRQAINRYLQHERQHKAQYCESAKTYLPFHRSEQHHSEKVPT